MKKLVPQSSIKQSKPIFYLTFISLICEILGSITYFISYSYSSDGQYKISVVFPSVISLFYLALGLAPVILLFLYIIKYGNNQKYAGVIPAIYGLIALPPLLALITQIIGGYGLNVLSVIMYIALVVSFGLATLFALKGLGNKVYSIIASVVGFIVVEINMITLFSNLGFYVEVKMFLYIITNPINAISSITLFAALLVFALNNRIPAILSTKPVDAMSSEQALRSLKESFESGIITEEEYQSKRAEIINQL